MERKEKVMIPCFIVLSIYMAWRTWGFALLGSKEGENDQGSGRRPELMSRNEIEMDFGEI